MSEKYSTEVMINFLEDWWGTAQTEVRISIIAKLRAGDRLCKELSSLFSLKPIDGDYPSQLVVKGRLLKKINNAIADYEGREEK